KGIFQNPIPDFAVAAPVFFPFQSFRSFILLMAAESVMSLWLCYFLNVVNGCIMCFPDYADTGFYNLTHSGIITAFHCVNVNTIGTCLFFQALQSLGNGPFGSLQSGRN